MTEAEKYAWEKFNEKAKGCSPMTDCSGWAETKFIHMCDWMPLEWQTKEYAEKFFNESKEHEK